MLAAIVSDDSQEKQDKSLQKRDKLERQYKIRIKNIQRFKKENPD